MSAARSSRERWIYGRHALAGLLLALPTLGLIGDWLLRASEAFLFFLAMTLWFSLRSLLPFLAVGWVALIGYGLWTGDPWSHFGRCRASMLSHCCCRWWVSC